MCTLGFGVRQQSGFPRQVCGSTPDYFASWIACRPARAFHRTVQSSPGTRASADVMVLTVIQSELDAARRALAIGGRGARAGRRHGGLPRHRHGPYREDSPTAPISVYGRSRVAAERLVLARPDTVVVRAGRSVRRRPAASATSAADHQGPERRVVAGDGGRDLALVPAGAGDAPARRRHQPDLDRDRSGPRTLEPARRRLIVDGGPRRAIIGARCCFAG